MRILFSLFLLASIFTSYGQDPARLNDEIVALLSQPIPQEDGRPLALFVGSSSFRLWNTLATDLSEFRTINRGFGGSEMSDLLYYADQLIGTVNPDLIFIYEGDNDLAHGEDEKSILAEAKRLIDEIKVFHPNAEIYFVSAKPSLSRWHLKEKYINFNYQLSLYTLFTTDLHFIDVWTALCDDQGDVYEDIFLEDELHLNAKGYEKWVAAFREVLIR